MSNEHLFDPHELKLAPPRKKKTTMSLAETLYPNMPEVDHEVCYPQDLPRRQLRVVGVHDRRDSSRLVGAADTAIEQAEDEEWILRPAAIRHCAHAVGVGFVALVVVLSALVGYWRSRPVVSEPVKPVRSYVVQPGDTIESVASALADGKDSRLLVDDLVRQLSGNDLRAGRVIELR